MGMDEPPAGSGNQQVVLRGTGLDQRNISRLDEPSHSN
jgi:hypothetical protein